MILRPRAGILSPRYLATTVGTFAMIAFVAFEAMAVATIMPTVARDLEGLGLFALAFAAPLASGVVGMVAAGQWSDRRGPTGPLLASLGLFALGLLVCGASTSMELFLAGRVVQGLGGGALIVGLYVLVGVVYPGSLQPAIFAAFAAAWVLPALFGPGLAAAVAHAWSWHWVFLGVVVLVLLAFVLLSPALRLLPAHEPTTTGHQSSGQLPWAVLGAVAVLVLELLGSSTGPAAVAAVAVFVLVVLSLRRLLPAGTLLGRRGLPAVIASRGLLSASFFCAEAYIVYVLQEHWGLTAGHAGIALTVVGVVWALSSQAQSRLGSRISHRTAILTGTAVVLAGTALVALGVGVFAADGPVPAVVPAAAYVLAGAGMGFAYPRTSVAVLDASTDADRGSHSSALSVADSLGAALALSVAGAGFAVAQRAAVDPFLAVFVLATGLAAVGVIVAGRTGAPRLSA